MAEIEQDELIRMRQENIGRLFQRAARLYSELAVTKFENYGRDSLTLVHTALISNLDIQGTQISTIAERAGMSKQAMGQIAKELEEQGYITRIPDPNDKRGVLLKFTENGLELLQDAYHIKTEIEAEFAEILGVDEMTNLRDLLSKLIENAPH